MATHSSILAWEISWTEEPGRLQSMGSQRVGHAKLLDKHAFFSPLLLSRPVVSDSLQLHRLQHARPPVPHHLPEFAQVHVHCISDAIQPSHLLTKILELQLQDQSFQ